MRRTWIKLYVDQCLRGSMIEELTPAQRWLWFGLLLMAGDSSIPGVIFRRRDENGILVGFSDITIAETLDVDIETYRDGIRRMIEKNKIAVDDRAVIFIVNWNKYQSEYQRQKPYRKDGYKKVSNQGDDADIERDVDVDVEGDKNNGQPKTSAVPLSESEIEEKFKDFWSAYPREGRLARKESRVKFGALVKRGELAEFIKGFHGYIDYLKHQQVKNKFDQRPMYAKTFLNGRWAEFVGFKFEPEL